jgi:hypothetical protein
MTKIFFAAVQFGETPLGVAPEGSLSRSILADELQRRKFEVRLYFEEFIRFPPMFFSDLERV